MSDILVLITESDHLGKLATLLDLNAAEATALVVGDRALAEEAAAIVPAVKWVDSKGAPAESYAAAVARAVAQAAPKAVLAVATPGSRAALGAFAFENGAVMVSNAVSLEVAGDAVRADHLVLNSKVVESVEMPAPAVVLVDALALKADEAAKDAAGAIEEIAAESAGAVEIMSIEAAERSALQDAEVVVSVGRGISGCFEAAQQLCSTLGGEMGCSMPAASELGLLPLERYVGMSGKHIEPKLYIALGISGLTHHVLGVKNARAIVVVNKDPKAFFFENSDYGIVGDVAEVIPELERAFKAAL